MSTIPAGKSEAGAVAVLYAITMLVMLGVLAIVIDLGAVRADSRAVQLTADMAATGGVSQLLPDGASPRAACEAAVDYFVENTPNVTHPGYGACTAFPVSGADCMLLDPNYAEREASFTVDPYAVTIRWPVDLDDGGLEYDSEIDGHRCDRLAVEISRTRGFVFGPVLNQPGGGTGARAVARMGLGENTPGAALVVLDRTNCRALWARGQSKILVLERPAEGTFGRIMVDSNASGSCSSTYAIDLDSGGNNRIMAGVTQASLNAYLASGVHSALEIGDGMISAHALLTNPTRAYRTADTDDGKLAPRPTSTVPMTRAPIDHRYNCKTGYSFANHDIDPCADAPSTPAHLDQLKADVGTTPGVPPGGSSYNWRRYSTWMAGGYTDPVAHPGLQAPPTISAGQRCSPPSSAPDIDFPAGYDWWIDCPDFTFSNTVRFASGSNVVTDGRVVSGAHARLSVNPGNEDVFFFIRSGRFSRGAQASIQLNRTFVYLQNGHISFGAGSEPLRWTAPNCTMGAGEYDCGDPDDPAFPTYHPFWALALWSESSVTHDLGGAAVLDLAGVFFTPNATPFEFKGQPEYSAADAQFISWQLHTWGQSHLALRPARWMVGPPDTAVRLIR